MREVWLCTKWNLRALLKSYRSIMCLLMGFLLCFLLTEFSISLSQTYQTNLQAFEPFIWCFADGDNILYAALVLMLLLAGLPRLDAAASYFIFRINRKKWVISQIFTIFIVTLIYCTFLLFSTLILCLNLANFGNNWSETAVLLSFSTDAFQTAVTVVRKVIKVTKPYQSLLDIFFLLFQYVLFVGLLQLVVTIWKNKKTGVSIALSLHMLSYLLTPDRFMAWLAIDESYRHVANLLAAWLSPLQHATYMMHNFGYDKLPRLNISYLLLGSISIFFAILAYRQMGKMNFQFGGDGLYVE